VEFKNLFFVKFLQKFTIITINVKTLTSLNETLCIGLVNNYMTKVVTRDQDFTRYSK